MKILDGIKVSNKIREKIKTSVNQLGFKPTIGIVMVGDGEASKVYVRNKIRACEQCGFQTNFIKFDFNITEEELLKEVEKLNGDNTIDGFIVQLPLPKHIDEVKITNTINPLKDIDGFHPQNLGKLVVGDKSGFIPATPYGIMLLLDEYGINTVGKNCVIIGRSNIVGKPLANLMVDKNYGNCTVTVLNSQSTNIVESCRNADIIIAACGQPRFVTSDMVKDGAVVIDVGINRVNGKLCGDVDFENVKGKCSYITPVPGGIGPMTITALMMNTLKTIS